MFSHTPQGASLLAAAPPVLTSGLCLGMLLVLVSATAATGPP